MALNIRRVVIFEVLEIEKGPTSLLGYWSVLFLDLEGGYIGLFSLWKFMVYEHSSKLHFDNSNILQVYVDIY